MLAIKGARIAPLPPEGTEWWIGGGVPKAIDRAARLGDCWYGNADLTPDTAARDIAIYREACARHGRRAGPDPDPQGCVHRREPGRGRAGGRRPGGRGLPGVRSERPSPTVIPPRVAEQLSVYRRPRIHRHHHPHHVATTAELGPEGASRSVELAGEVRTLLA